jgi:hypothetical protein
MISEETFEPNGEPVPDDGSSEVATKPNDEQKSEIARWVSEGMGLSDIQKKINDDFAVVMTYMDVRFLVDDLNLTLVDEEEPAEDTAAEDTAAEDTADADTGDLGDTASEDSPPAGGGVQVELDTVNPPGSMASGSVVFSDGERKSWSVDQFGRLGLSGGSEDYKPSEEDIAEFQKALDSALRGKGL